MAELCELAFRQAPARSSRSDGGFPDSLRSALGSVLVLARRLGVFVVATVSRKFQPFSHFSCQGAPFGQAGKVASSSEPCMERATASAASSANSRML